MIRVVLYRINRTTDKLFGESQAFPFATLVLKSLSHTDDEEMEQTLFISAKYVETLHLEILWRHEDSEALLLTNTCELEEFCDSDFCGTTGWKQ